MSLTQPIDVLMHEHRLIEQVLSALEQRVADLGQQPFPAEFFEKALDFFANYADGCHHYKEEDALFPLMKERGIPEQGGPIGCMLHDHQFGRACLRGVRENLAAARGGSREAMDAIRRHATEYIAMLRGHIFKEDNVLFRLAYQALTPADMMALEADFAREDNPKINQAVRERYEALAAELAAAALPQASYR